MNEPQPKPGATPRPRLELFVHDYDRTEASRRATALLKCLDGDPSPAGPDEVNASSKRSQFLRWIADRPEPTTDQTWPLALIDLLDGHESASRGLDLIETIARHPRLHKRVRVVAFTRYGAYEIDGDLLSVGAHAVLDPRALDDTDQHRTIVAWLARLAGEPPPANRIDRLNEPPSAPSLELKEMLRDLFPSLRYRTWPTVAVVRQYLTWAAEGYDYARIHDQIGALEGKQASTVRNVFDKLREELLDQCDLESESTGGDRERRIRVIRFLDDAYAWGPERDTVDRERLGRHLIRTYGAQSYTWIPRPRARPWPGGTTIASALRHRRLLYDKDGLPLVDPWISDADMETFWWFVTADQEAEITKRDSGAERRKYLAGQLTPERRAEFSAAIYHVCTCLSEAVRELQ